MKKLCVTVLALIMSLALCLSLTACSGKTVEQLQNEFGAVLEGGKFGEGSVLNFDKVDNASDKAGEIFEKLGEVGVTITDQTKVYIYDISVTKDGKEVRPSGKVKLTVPLPQESGVTGYTVYHIGSDGKAAEIPATYANGKLTFETDGFSYFAFVATSSDVPPAPIEFTVIATAGEGGSVTDGYANGKKVEAGTSVTLTAVPDNGYHFIGWFVGETKVSEDAGYTFTVSEDVTLVAQFEKDAPIEFTVIATAGEGGSITDGYANGKKVEAGSSVTLTAVPDNGYHFVGWFVGETKVSEEASYTFTVSEDVTLVAQFEKDAPIEFTVIATAGEGGSITDGYANGKKVEAGSSVTLTAVPDNGYHFVGWFVDNSKVSEDESYIFTVDADITLVAQFEKDAPTTYRFLCDIRGNGTIWENDTDATETYKNGATLSAGTKITLTAKPSDDWEFKGWYRTSGETPISTETTYTFDLTDDTVVYALFEEKVKYNFIATVTPYEGGYISENGQPVDFGNGRQVEPGTQITLTAGANADYNFKGWYSYTADQREVLISDQATYTFTVNEPTTVFAKFEEKVKYNFLAQCSPYGGGYITENGQKVDFGNGRQVDPGTKITLTAVANSGYAFKGWYNAADDSLISADATHTFTVTENTYVQAVFEEKPNGLRLDAHNAGFTYNENGELVTTVYQIGSDGQPNAERVLVYATYPTREDRYLTLNTDYTIDLGGLDLTKVGTYTITYTYIEDPSLTATLTVQVTKPTNVAMSEAEWNAAIAYWAKQTNIKIMERISSPDYDDDRGAQIMLYQLVGTAFSENGWFENSQESQDYMGKLQYWVKEGEAYSYIYWEAYLNNGAGGWTKNPDITRNEYQWNLDYRIYAYCDFYGEKIDFNYASFTYDPETKSYKNSDGSVTIVFTFDDEVLTKIVVTLVDAKLNQTAVSTVTFGDAVVEPPLVKDNYTFKADIETEGGTGVGGYITEDGRQVDYTSGKTFAAGAPVTLTAVANEGYRFAGWYRGSVFVSADATYTFHVNDETTIYARFKQETPSYRFTLQIEGNGKVYQYYTDAGDKYQNGVTLEAGTTVTLRAESGDKYKFDGWYRGETRVSTLESYTFTVNEDMTVTAKFTAIPMATLKVICEGGGTILLNGEPVDLAELSNGIELPANSQFNLTAVPDDGKVFAGWYNGTTLISKDVSLSHSIQGDCTITAKFGAPIAGLRLDGTYAGFATKDGSLYVLMQKGESGPTFSLMNVYLVYTNGDADKKLTSDEYTVDLGGYDANQVGTYTITYTYNADPTVQATAVIEVVEKLSYLSLDKRYEDGSNTSYYGDAYSLYINGEKATGGYLAPGSNVTLQATKVGTGLFFKGWCRVVDGKMEETLLSTEETYTFTMPEEDVKIYALFEKAITVKVYKNGVGDIYIDGEKVDFGDSTTYKIDVRAGTQMTFTTVPGENYERSGWQLMVPGVGTDKPTADSVTVTFGAKADGYDGYTSITAVFEPKVVSLSIDTASAEAQGFFDGIRQHLIGSSLPDLSAIKFTGVRADGSTVELTADDIRYLTDALESAIAGNNAGICDVTFVYGKNENVKTTLQMNLIDREKVSISYSKQYSYLDHAYNGKASFISREDILVTYNGKTYKLNEITCAELLELFGWEWRDSATNALVSVEGVDVTINGSTVSNFGPYKLTVGSELCGPCAAGKYRFTLRYNGSEVVTAEATIRTKTFEKITERGEFTTNAGSTWVNFDMYYFTIVGIGEDGNYYIMQMPKIGSDGNFEAEARMITPNADGTLDLGDGLDFAFVNVNYYAGSNIYWPSDSTDYENKLTEFLTGYYGSYYILSSSTTSDGTQWGPPAIYRTGFTTVSGGHISRQTGTKSYYTYGNLTLFDQNTGAVTIYAPRAGQTEKDRLRLVKDGDRYVFTSKSTDEDDRPSFDIYIYRASESGNSSTETTSVQSRQDAVASNTALAVAWEDGVSTMAVPAVSRASEGNVFAKAKRFGKVVADVRDLTEKRYFATSVQYRRRCP